MGASVSRYTAAAAALLVLSLLVPCAAGAWTVGSSVNRKSMTTADELMLTVTIKDADGKVDTSPIKDFSILNSMRSSSTRIIDNVRTVLVEYHFQLKPRRQGVLSIPPLKVTVGGRIYRTNLVRIKVDEQQGEPAQNSDVFVRAAASRLSVWEGEQFVYNYALYSRARLLGGQGHPPSFEGFTAHELKAHEGPEMYEGQQYGVTAWPFLLTPVKTGTLTIEPAEVEVQVAVRRRGGSGSLFDQFFGGSMFAGDPFGASIDNRKLLSEPVEVEVKPLPSYTGPGVFSGLVGRFTVTARADRTDLKTGDSATLTVEIAGRGNLYDVAGPEIIPPEGLKVYEDAPEEQIRSGRDGTTGARRFRWALVPLEPGTYSLGPFPLVYFDVEQEKYVSLSAGPVELTVTGAPTGGLPDSGGARPAESKKPSRPAAEDAPSALQATESTGTVNDLLPLMDGPDAAVDNAPASPWLFLVLLLVPPCGYICVCLIMRAREKAGAGGRAMSAEAGKALKRAAREKHDPAACLALLSRALVYAVHARAGTPGESLTREEACVLLQDDEALAGEVCALLDEIESARWGGSGPGGTDTDTFRSRTKKIVGRLAG